MSGLDAVGIVSSIFQIADLGARVALRLCTFRHQVKQAESSIQNLSKDVSLTHTVLRQFGDNLLQNDQIQLYSPNAFATAQEIRTECERLFREIESAMDRDLSICVSRGVKNPFHKLSQKLHIVFKEPQLDVLQAKLDRLKNNMLLVQNVIIFASHWRKAETETSMEDQKQLIKMLDQQKRDSDARLEQLTKAIAGIKPDNSSAFAQNQVSVDVFNNAPAIGSSADKASDFPALSARLAELSLVPKVTDDQFGLISQEVGKYSGLMKDILERIQDAESILAANRHRRIKQMVLDAHAAELQIFTVDYGEKAGELCAQLCQGPLFDPVPCSILAATAEVSEHAGSTRARKKRTKKRKKNRRGARLPEAQTEHQMIATIIQKITPIPDVETERGQVNKDTSPMGREHRTMTSLPDLDRVDVELRTISGEGEPSSADNFFDLKGLLSSWTTLTADELIMI
ncbi:hypothetical protein PISL3812_09523 [Talaromyces islandicus]|uniref:Fungal N-terminal domain-containing protein n=1 Tax=Talaromyces islandicus TaxID=28573 RepID=A0A0U1MAY6_TALIS|nr:hypothetical protein PISL3812_09523 [Talaromyces islandicus]